MMSSMQNIAADQLIHLAKMALKRVSVSEEDADLTAKMLVTADLMGITPHGTRRLGPYIERIRRGLITLSLRLTYRGRASNSTCRWGQRTRTRRCRKRVRSCC